MGTREGQQMMRMSWGGEWEFHAMAELIVVMTIWSVGWIDGGKKWHAA